MALQNIITGSIVAGNTSTNPIQVNELSLIGLTTGSNITATALTFLVSTDGVTYTPLYDSTSTEVSLTVTTAARSYALKPDIFYGWNFLKVVEGTSASNVAQKTVNTILSLNAKAI